tara:strand:+ start:1512 stop:1796 length:285 start_codon:yes stop_codon:yes gene_type:complete
MTSCVVSDGKRTGKLIKFSHKGLVCKSWEGTLQTGETEATQFQFSVDDEHSALVDSLKVWDGKEITLTYEQWSNKLPCTTDTKYYIEKATVKIE